MHRFYLPPEKCRGSVLELSAADSHHARNVLRLAPGARVVVMDGRGAELSAEVAGTGGGAVELRVRQRNVLRPLPYRVTAMLSVLKGKAMDWVVRKATELGVHGILPVLSERSIPYFDSGQAARKKVSKWRQVAIEALKQCGVGWLPEIGVPVTPRDLIGRKEEMDLVLLASLQGDARHPRSYVEAFEQEHGRLPRTLGLWVGPEGDYTPAELSLIKSSGALPITLGQNVLRSETAALYGLSILHYEMQAPRPARNG